MGFHGQYVPKVACSAHSARSAQGFPLLPVVLSIHARQVCTTAAFSQFLFPARSHDAQRSVSKKEVVVQYCGRRVGKPLRVGVIDVVMHGYGGKYWKLGEQIRPGVLGAAPVLGYGRVSGAFFQLQTGQFWGGSRRLWAHLRAAVSAEFTGSPSPLLLPGDAFIRIQIMECPPLRRQGLDIHFPIVVPLHLALCGGRLSVPVFGTKDLMHIPIPERVLTILPDMQVRCAGPALPVRAPRGGGGGGTPERAQRTMPLAASCVTAKDAHGNVSG